MLLTRLKLPLVSKIVVKRALQSASKFCVREGYRAVARNRNYFELAKQATFVTKLINANGQKDVEEVSESEEKSEFSIFSFALESVIIFLRVVVITSVLTGLLTFYCVSRLLRLGHYPTVYLKAIEFLGPTFVKFGQWMSTRRDVYSAELCDCLATLQRDSSAHSWHYTRHLLEATYGPNWRDLFPIFETSPVGSGCCAQVHRAFIDPSRYRDRVKSYPTVPVYVDVAEFLYLGYLIDHFSKTSVYTSFQPGVLPSETLNNRLFPGNSDKAKRNTFSFPVELRPVAVKVLHPRTGERLRQDLKILRFVSKCAQFIVPSLKWLSISESVDDFSEIMAKQVDLEFEARNLVEFNRNFWSTPEVQFPWPYATLSNKSILVETFQEGRPICEYVNEKDATLRRKLAEIGLRSVFKMIFDDNFVHCDLHPGNMLVQERKKDPKIRLVILDCGLATSLTEDYRRNLREVFHAVATGDGRRAAGLMLEHSPHECEDPEGFRTSVDNIIKSHLNSGAKLDKINVGHVMTELFAALVNHRVQQDASFSSVILSIVVIEGLGRSLDPSIDIIRELGPFVASNKFWD